MSRAGGRGASSAGAAARRRRPARRRVPQPSRYGPTVGAGPPAVSTLLADVAMVNATAMGDLRRRRAGKAPGLLRLAGRRHKADPLAPGVLALRCSWRLPPPPHGPPGPAPPAAVGAGLGDLHAYRCGGPAGRREEGATARHALAQVWHLLAQANRRPWTGRQLTGRPGGGGGPPVYY